MTDTAQTVANTVAQTLESLAPVAIAGAVAANPQASSIMALVPTALNFLQLASQLTNAGAMTPDQLATLFAQVGKGIQSTHAQWLTMNAADASGLPSILQTQVDVTK